MFLEVHKSPQLQELYESEFNTAIQPQPNQKNTAISRYDLEEVSVSSLDLVIKKFLQLMNNNDSQKRQGSSLERNNKSDTYKLFELKAKYQDGIDQFILRIKKYTQFEDSMFVLSLILLDRSLQNFPELKTSDCLIKLLCACITIASKLTDHDNLYMSCLSKIFGMKLSQLFELEEKLFLDILGCNAYVTEKEYNAFYKGLKLTYKES